MGYNNPEVDLWIVSHDAGEEGLATKDQAERVAEKLEEKYGYDCTIEKEYKNNPLK